MSRDAVSQFFEELKERIIVLVRETVAEEMESAGGVRRGASPADLIDEQTRRQISEHALISNKTYLTRAEAAKYLGVSERSIAEWSVRPPDHNPLPVCYAGGDPRYKREAVNEWVAAEARQRLKLAG